MRVNHLILLKIRNMMDINVDLLQWPINFFDKKTSCGTVKNEIMSNKKIAEEFHKPIIRKYKKRKVRSPFIDNIWAADRVDMQLISKFSKGIRFLLCAIDLTSISKNMFIYKFR